MISSFRHKGLQAFYESGTTKGIRPDLARRIAIILAILDEADGLDDLNRPSLRLHELAGTRKNTWAVSVNGPWRITFLYENGSFSVLDLEQYH